jgi:alpha-D-ribose 1-methylphosphonate 5-triphosphate synthase subunit PhnG
MQDALQDAPGTTQRQHWMAVLARAPEAAMQQLLADCPPLPGHVKLRGPETGLVMTRGRAGGGGAAFNLGEMTVTRCTVRSGAHVGHAYIAGRDFARAELAARLDAALQDPALHPALMERLVAPLAGQQQAARQKVARQAAATRVQFFTMATMRS